MPTGNTEIIYAHTLLGQDERHWELLKDHALNVAVLAAEFCSAFHAEDWGKIAGLWHDLGKASATFQRYLRESHDTDAGEESAPDRPASRVDHSTFGARHAAKSIPNVLGQLMAFCIAGHHAGLADATTGDGLHQRATLASRLNPEECSIPSVTLPNEIAQPPQLKFPLSSMGNEEIGFAFAFFARMVFSALIDADRLATESFCNDTQSAERRHVKPQLSELQAALDHHLAALQGKSFPTTVNKIRAAVLADCVKAATLSPGFFSLNVPTGGGKTLASLAFALYHARQYPSLRRVVVAIPFTSIIDQTADVYRRALGPLADYGLIEHHSSLNPSHDTRQNKLAVENWDAPLIVTTNVQLFESLFAARTAPARKLHRLANSVIILDEAQTIPIDLLTPTLAALKELVARYGCTIVLCTATQPALEHRPEDFNIGLRNVRPIIADAPALHAQLKRVVVERTGTLGDEELVARLANERQVLCVVNTKAHAANLYDALVARRGQADGCYHLSTFMCAKHRRDIFARIRQRLGQKKSCRVISTQLIEAGVDVDFPCVYRAAAGFDSIAQAAGRCNREGKLKNEREDPVPGRVYVFDGKTPPPPGLLRQAADAAKELADDYLDPLEPLAVDAYFKLLYWSRKHEWDKHGVMPCFQYNRFDASQAKLIPLKFKSAAQAYQLIRDEQTPILAPYTDEAREMIAYLRTGAEIDYLFFRKAQQYTVSVRNDLLQRLVGNAALFQHPAGLWVLANESAYTPEKGMSPNAAGLSPEALTL